MTIIKVHEDEHCPHRDEFASVTRFAIEFK
jgi:hypothetical protein